MDSKIFIVGYPRSGTTLLQTLLMCDKRVYSCPETHIYDLAHKPRKLNRFLPTPLRMSIYSCFWFLENYSYFYVPIASSRDEVIKKFFDKLSVLARDNDDQTIFLEKTPDHLWSLAEIRSHFPKCKIIHIVRNRHDAANSFVKASKNWSFARDFDQASLKWFDCVARSIFEISKENDLLVRYEDIVNNLESVVKDLNEYLQLDIQAESVTADIKINAKKVVSKKETWKSNNLSKGLLASGSRRDDVLLQKYIKKISELVG